MKRYPAYKDSGVEWIGEIPTDWMIERLKYHSDCNTSNVDKLSNSDELSVLLCNYTDVYKNDKICSDIQFMAATASLSEIERFELRKDDVLITKDSETPEDIAVPAFVPENLENVLCGYHLALLRSHKEYLLGWYMYYLFKSYRFNQQFTIAANGITRYGLSINDVRNAFIPLPPLPEQMHVARFLDRNISQIDDLIAKKQKLIELLKEERTALINQAVTKGLDPNVPMKDSGIEWLGEIPEHWKLIPLKRVSRINPTKSEIILPESTPVVFLPMERVSDNGDYNDSELIPIQELKGGFTYFAKGDVIVAKITPCFENGKGAFLENLQTPIGFGSTEFHVLRSIPDISSAVYLYYFTHSYCFTKVAEAFMVGTAGQKRVQTSFLENYIIPLPPYHQQINIAAALKRMLTQIENSIQLINREIDLISEYKTSLINEAVTGKIDVGC